ncbi:Nuclear hormone receptor family member nhr-71 [Toxocara canis]|uniref:Nuclear hormone receptor family member nhr-71 n=1 Tax=Toxocara canis TaxID=6265 RepID=A0A0B2VWZ4_TOXCA|nr:Nuclear hormone receptor family member nhr-71 [Toxocara canis]
MVEFGCASASFFGTSCTVLYGEQKLSWQVAHSLPFLSPVYDQQRHILADTAVCSLPFGDERSMSMSANMDEAIIVVDDDQICGSPSNGYHFGALSCAACNAFFRRSVAESRKYFCRKDGECVIDQNARCFCRACRLKKCLEKGMDPNAVQPHRDIIGQKRKRQFDERRRDVPDSALTVAIDNVEPQTSYKLSPVLAQHNTTNHTTLRTLSHDNCNTAQLLSSPSRKEVTPPRVNGSATAQLLTSPSVIAEQLLAFSRTPLIAAASHEERSVNLHQTTASLAPQSFSSLSSPAPSVSEPSSVSSAPVQPTFCHADVHRERCSLSECHADEVPLQTDKLLRHTITFDDYHRDVEHEEIVEHYSNVPSTSSDWYYDDTDGKQWHRTDSVPRGCSPAKVAYDPSANQIEQLVQSYVKLRERRRLIYCPGTLRDILGGTEPPLRPAVMGEHCSSYFRIEVGLIAEFINSIHPYPKLRLDDRILLFKKASVPYSVLEKHYVTMRLGGYQANRIINTDYSYHDLAAVGIEKRLPGSEQGAPDGKSGTSSTSADSDDSKTAVNEAGKMAKADPVTIRRLLITPLREAMRSITGPMYHFGMTDVEFVSLVVVILFDHSTPGLSEPAKRLVKEARDRMYHDWFAYYEAHGIADGPQRVGNAMLILPALKERKRIKSQLLAAGTYDLPAGLIEMGDL